MIDCTPQEICDAVIEALKRLDGEWKDNEEILELQNKFKVHQWNKLSVKHSNLHTLFYHGVVRANYSSQFLLDNKDWLN